MTSRGSKNNNKDLEPSHLLWNNTEERLLLPRQGSNLQLEEYLSSLQPVVSRAEELFQTQNPLEQEDLESRFPRCLNVLQGEVAHASSEHVDIVVSAEATTCHVVALRSTTSATPQGIDDGGEPLTSVAHIDDAHAYEECLERMINEHLEHHQQKKLTIENSEERQDEEDYEFGLFLESEDEEEEENEIPITKGRAVADAHQEELEERGGFLPNPLGARDTNNRTRVFSEQREPKSSSSMPNLCSRTKDNTDENDEDNKIHMELHMVGGFKDDHGTSQELSNSLVQSFNRLAGKYQDALNISLSTAAITSLNTSTCTNDNEEESPRNYENASSDTKQPVCRGLGIDTRTGNVFPLRRGLPAHLEGPAVDVRSARGFAASTTPTTNTALSPSSSTEHHYASSAPSLAIIHDTSCSQGEIRVQPFSYQAHPQLDVLMQVPDDVLLQCTSTSPAQELVQPYCANVRRTLSFVNTTSPDHVFGAQGREAPLVYVRSAHNLNEWERAASSVPA